MKFFTASCLLFLFSCTTKQLTEIEGILSGSPASALTQDEAAQGLKDALLQGFTKGVNLLNQENGFLNSAYYKIYLPEQAQDMEKRLRGLGMDAQVDKAITGLNRGAEMAVGEAKSVFTDAIQQMTIQDAIGILTGGENAATDYLQKTTAAALRSKFSPIIDQSLEKVGALRYWSEIANFYNNIPFVEPVQDDLNAYVTEKAMTALFDRIRTEESLIRKDPLLRVTDVMKKAFAYADGVKH